LYPCTVEDDEIREVFAANLRRLMRHARDRFAENPALEGLGTASGLEVLTGVSDSAIGRYKKGKVGAPIDHVQRIARAFGLQAWEMLYPHLDPVNPPEVMSAERTKELQETLVAAAKLLGTTSNGKEGEVHDAGAYRGGATNSKVPGKSPKKHRHS
jgi:hypothetical protein